MCWFDLGDWRSHTLEAKKNCLKQNGVFEGGGRGAPRLDSREVQVLELFIFLIKFC